MSRPLRFEGKTMEAARLRARETLGAEVAEMNVTRHGKELYGGLFGFFQRERYVIEVADGEVTAPQALEAPLASSPRRRQQAPLAPSSAPGHQTPLSASSAPRQEGPLGAGAFHSALLEALAHDTVGVEMPSAEAPASRHGTSGEIPVPDRLAALLDNTTDTVGVSFDRELKGVIEDAEAVVFDAAGTCYEAPSTITRPSERRSPPDPIRSAPSWFGLGVNDAAGLVGSSFSERLFAAGLAEEYLPDPLFSEPALALPLRLGTIPGPRPVVSGPGDVLVVVGDLDESLKVADQLARRLDEDDTVLVVSHRRLPCSMMHARARTALEAGTVVLERRLAGLVTLVVVDSACRNGFVPSTIAGIRPEAIWGVVPASWDERRVRSFERLVGHLDALGLYGLVSSERPAGLIGRAWPVAYVDGWEASPLCVAARLVEAVKGEES